MPPQIINIKDFDLNVSNFRAFVREWKYLEGLNNYSIILHYSSGVRYVSIDQQKVRQHRENESEKYLQRFFNDINGFNYGHIEAKLEKINRQIVHYISQINRRDAKVQRHNFERIERNITWAENCRECLRFVRDSSLLIFEITLAIETGGASSVLKGTMASSVIETYISMAQDISDGNNVAQVSIKGITNFKVSVIPGTHGALTFIKVLGSAAGTGFAGLTNADTNTINQGSDLVKSALQGSGVTVLQLAASGIKIAELFNNKLIPMIIPRGGSARFDATTSNYSFSNGFHLANFWKINDILRPNYSI
jgi:hypothetical protein